MILTKKTWLTVVFVRFRQRLLSGSQKGGGGGGGFSPWSSGALKFCFRARSRPIISQTGALILFWLLSPESMARDILSRARPSTYLDPFLIIY